MAQNKPKSRLAELRAQVRDLSAQAIELKKLNKDLFAEKLVAKNEVFTRENKIREWEIKYDSLEKAFIRTEGMNEIYAMLFRKIKPLAESDRA